MNDEQRGDRSEFSPSAEALRTVTVDSIDGLAGRIDRLRIPRDVYYAEVEPVLGKIRKRLEGGK